MENEIFPTIHKGTIIIVAVYINNNLNNYNELVKCLIQLRHVYADTVIVAVDNGSLNSSWHEIANNLNITVLCNTSVSHRFEIGAYKLALQHFRADSYIFIQGTIFINNVLDLSLLDTSEEKVICFGLIQGFAGWGQDGLDFVNKLLAEINMSWQIDDVIVLWNCFCCNDAFIKTMLTSGIFDLPSTTKAHSCAFERILGCYFKKIQPHIPCIPNSDFIKIYLGQDPCNF